MPKLPRKIVRVERTPSESEQNGTLGYETGKLNRNPIDPHQGGRPKLKEGETTTRSLAFNTYLAQLEEPRSFINVIPDIMRDAVTLLPQELVGLDEDALLDVLEEHYKYKPTAAVEAMRNNFWMEYDRVSTTKTEVMNQSNIYLGVVSREMFYKMLKESPHALAYILCRSPEYEAVMRGLLNLSTRKIMAVLNLPLKRADGSIQDPKVIELVLKAAAMVDLRAKGGYVQRSETKNLNLVKQTSYTNVFNAASSTKSPDMVSLAQDIDEKLAALEKELSASPGLITMQTTEPSQQQPKVPDGISSEEQMDAVEAEFKETF